MSEKAGWRLRRFDVAGAHPDEVWRAVADVSEVVEELRKAVYAGPDVGAVNLAVGRWRQRKPLRFGNGPDADVQRFLAAGVELLDGLERKLPFGLSGRQRQIRNRCDELANSMEKVLEKRPDEQSFDPWRAVKISVEAAAAKNETLLAPETRQRYRLALRGCFPRGPAEANRARTQYRIWEQNAERFQKEGPMNGAAQAWKRFMGVIDNMRIREQAKGVVWGRVDDVNGIDFKPALQPQQSFRRNPKIRM